MEDSFSVRSCPSLGRLFKRSFRRKKRYDYDDDDACDWSVPSSVTASSSEHFDEASTMAAAKSSATGGSHRMRSTNSAYSLAVAFLRDGRKWHESRRDFGNTSCGAWSDSAAARERRTGTSAASSVVRPRFRQSAMSSAIGLAVASSAPPQLSCTTSNFLPAADDLFYTELNRCDPDRLPKLRTMRASISPIICCEEE